MRKLLTACLFLALTSTVAFAAKWSPVGITRIGDRQAFQQASAELIAATGNPMVGMFIGGLSEKCPFAELLGPTREGASCALVFLVDEECPTTTNIEFAVLYPVMAGKQKFLAGNEGSYETNGVVRIRHGGEDLALLFSPDDLWVAVSDKPEQLQSAMGFRERAEKKLDKGELLSAEAEMAAVVRHLKALPAEECEWLDKDALAIIEQFDGARFAVAVNAAGVDLVTTIRARAGTLADQLCRTPVGKNPLAFASNDCIVAVAGASGLSFGGEPASAKKLLSLLEENEVKLPFITLHEPSPNCAIVEVDHEYLADEKNNEAIEAICEKVKELIDDKTKVKGLEKLTDYDVNKLNSAYGFGAKLKGLKSAYTADERFEATFPELCRKEGIIVGLVGETSIYELVKMILPLAEKFAAAESPEEAKSLQALSSLLPAPSKAGVGVITYRSGADICSRMRISSDEIKSFGVAFTLFMQSMMLAQ